MGLESSSGSARRVRGAAMVFMVLVELLPEAYEEGQRDTIGLLGRRDVVPAPLLGQIVGEHRPSDV